MNDIKLTNEQSEFLISIRNLIKNLDQSKLETIIAKMLNLCNDSEETGMIKMLNILYRKNWIPQYHYTELILKITNNEKIK